jgi:ATP-dependent protease Clp, ATPase subunit
MFELDKVELDFEDDALLAIAKEAIERKNRCTWIAFDYRIDNVRYDV